MKRKKNGPGDYTLVAETTPDRHAAEARFHLAVMEDILELLENA